MIDLFESVFPDPSVLQALRKWSQPGQKIYLVGGVVRDALLGIENHDLDLVVTGDVRRMAKKVANELNSPFYMMDMEHQIARIIFRADNGKPYFLDFAGMRGANIHADLSERDFTVNAMAVALDDLTQVIDPLKGMQDLKDRVLRVCSSSAFLYDPVRLLRAVRQSVNLKMRIEPTTLENLKAAAPHLRQVSAERLRDEFMRILEGRKVDTALRILDHYGLLEQVVLETRGLKITPQTAQQEIGPWEHTLATIRWLEKWLDLLAAEYQEDKSATLMAGMVTLQLGRHRERLVKHFDHSLTAARQRRGLLFLAVLLRESGKSPTRSVDASVNPQFSQHEQISIEGIARRAKELILSNLEVDFISVLVRHQIRIQQLAGEGSEITRRDIYRYFHDLGESGVDLCFITLADTLARYGVTIDPAYLERVLGICRQIMDAWFEQHDQIVDPPRLISGSDLIERFQLQPGPLIGEVLSQIHEAQAAGQVSNIEEAVDLAQSLIYRYKAMEEQPGDGT